MDIWKYCSDCSMKNRQRGEREKGQEAVAVIHRTREGGGS